MRHSHHVTPSRIHWRPRASNALEALDPAEKARIANKVFATIDIPVPRREGLADIHPVRDGRGLMILRASDRLGVLFRKLEDGQVEIVDVVTRDHGRTFSAFY